MSGIYKKATLSLLGLYWLNPDLFNDMVIPSGMDKDIIIDNLLADCAELEILYTDPEFFQKILGIWSKKELPVWQKLYNTTELVYNPIWNVDAHITERETRDLKNTYNGIEDVDGSNTNAKTGYNSYDLVTTERDSVTSAKKNINSGTDTGNIVREIERGGNIGVTSSQQLIKEEREIAEFNIYDFICNSFKKRFCLLVY